MDHNDVYWLWQEAEDGNKVTETECATLLRIAETVRITAAAKEDLLQRVAELTPPLSLVPLPAAVPVADASSQLAGGSLDAPWIVD